MNSILEKRTGYRPRQPEFMIVVRYLKMFNSSL